MSWDFATVKDIVQSVGIVCTLVLSVYAIIRSSKIAQNQDWTKRSDESNDEIEAIQKDLVEHKLQDATDIATLQTEVKNLKQIMDTKLEKILEKLDE